MQKHNPDMPIRYSSRIVLLNEKHEILLMKIQLPTYSLWCTIGGEIEPNESPLQAAKREVFEEIGYIESDVSWGSAIWYGEHIIDIKGTPTLHKETFFLGRTSRLNVDAKNLTDEEKSIVQKFRWWSIEELTATSEFIVPPRLAEYLNALIKDGIPKQTVTVDLSNTPPNKR